MAFLSHGIGNILNDLQATRAKRRERVERESREELEKRKKLETQSRAAQEWAKKEQAFIAQFPNKATQRKVLSELLRGLPFSSDSQAGRTMGIGRWWDNTEKPVVS